MNFNDQLKKACVESTKTEEEALGLASFVLLSSCVMTLGGTYLHELGAARILGIDRTYQEMKDHIQETNAGSPAHMGLLLVESLVNSPIEEKEILHQGINFMLVGANHVLESIKDKYPAIKEVFHEAKDNLLKEKDKVKH